MVSMKTEMEMPEVSAPDCCPVIYLNDDQVEALGITSPPPAGTVFKVVARAVAMRVSQEIEEPGEGETAPDICMSLQITDMELAPEAASRDMAYILYGG